jgi:hypothetical protein
MAVTYTWVFQGDSVNTKSISGNTDVITDIDWRLHGVDTVGGQEISAETAGNVKLDTTDLTSFIPFENLTPSDVETMVINALGDAAVAHYKTLISDAIANASDGFFNIFVDKPYVEEQKKSLSFA